ncbi:MAG: cobalamin-dependent protein [Nanoarchaeota archaeon]
MSDKRILLGSAHSVIEPLGLLHLGGLARDMGWERAYTLVKDHDFDEFFRRVNEFRPDVVGFNVYTGNHNQLHEALKKLRKDNPQIAVVVGGPHATYFPSETREFADFVVMSEGFGGLKSILEGTAEKGILPMSSGMRFPRPDRETFYAQFPEHANSPIKSIITMTGCPFKCSYCYNASTASTVAGNMPPEVATHLAQTLGVNGRLFPTNIRSVDDVVAEGREIVEKWPNTRVVYMQDDVHGFDTKSWMPEFAARWPKEVGIPYHAQMRWEMVKPDRLDLLTRAGCFGLTLAIESALDQVRSEVLNRRMPNQLMFDGMKAVIERGLKVRTEQITGLPYGATSVETPINLDADLALVKLNVDLRAMSGGPTMAWASTLAPYKGTEMGVYCARFGHYVGNNSDVPDTFFDKSVLRFPARWVGPSLEHRKDESGIWLEQDKLEEYRARNAELRRIFNFVTLVPEGHKLAGDYLKSSQPFSHNRLGEDTITHLRAMGENPRAQQMLERIDLIRIYISGRDIVDPDLRKDVESLAPYFACIPHGTLAVDRAIKYATRSNGHGKGVDPKVLSTAVRHHLYDNDLYAHNGAGLGGERLENSRTPSKV